MEKSFWTEPDFTRGSRLTVDLAALRANYRRLSSLAGRAAVGAVVKADAYGLGVVRIAPVLYDEGCRQFFVAQLCEALELRPMLASDADIYVLNGLQPGAEDICASAGVYPVLNSLDQLDAWSSLATRRGTTLSAALQVDTGMSRLGLSAAEVDELSNRPSLCDGLKLTFLMSHLACADDPADPANRAQLAAFRSLARRLGVAALSLANSGGIILDDAYHFDMVRAGIALYGVNPVVGDAVAMTPVCRLEANVIQVRDIGPGAGVGYGLTYHSTKAARLATLGVGYADGWPFRLGGRGFAYVDGVRVPIIGRISMDSMTIDISDLAKDALRAGDRVELIGAHQTLDDVAAAAETIPYDILTSLGHRYSRVYIDHDLNGDLDSDLGTDPNEASNHADPHENRGPRKRCDRNDHRLLSV